MRRPHSHCHRTQYLCQSARRQRAGMHTARCSLDILDGDETTIGMRNLAHWCPAMRLSHEFLHSTRPDDLGPMQGLDDWIAIDPHSRLETHILDEHLDGHMVSDLFHLSGRGVPARACLFHAVATKTVDSATVAASVDNER